MTSSNSSPTVHWFPPGSHAPLTAVEVPPGVDSLTRPQYVALLRRRLGDLAEKEGVKALELVADEPELAPLRESSPVEWPWLLLGEMPTVAGKVVSEIGLAGWPKKPVESPQAKRALAETTLAGWLLLVFPPRPREA